MRNIKISDNTNKINIDGRVYWYMIEEETKHPNYSAKYPHSYESDNVYDSYLQSFPRSAKSGNDTITTNLAIGYSVSSGGWGSDYFLFTGEVEKELPISSSITNKEINESFAFSINAVFILNNSFGTWTKGGSNYINVGNFNFNLPHSGTPRRLKAYITGTSPHDYEDEHVRCKADIDYLTITIYYTYGIEIEVPYYDIDVDNRSFYRPNHGFKNGDQVWLSNNNSDPPHPLMNEIPYYIVQATTDTFKLSYSLGGDPSYIETQGTGVNCFTLYYSQTRQSNNYNLMHKDSNYEEIYFYYPYYDTIPTVIIKQNIWWNTEYCILDVNKDVDSTKDDYDNSIYRQLKTADLNSSSFEIYTSISATLSTSKTSFSETWGFGSFSDFNFSFVNDGYSYYLQYFSEAHYTQTDNYDITFYQDYLEVYASLEYFDYYSSGDIIGGFIGSGELEEGDKISIDNCYSIGNITHSVNLLGGFIGYQGIGTEISNSYSWGNIDGDSVDNDIGGFVGSAKIGIYTNCYSIGKPTNLSGTVGGFCGIESDSTATSCYWDMETSEVETSSLGIGKTTEEMKQPETFINWDFFTIWNMKDYPTLKDKCRKMMVVMGYF